MRGFLGGEGRAGGEPKMREKVALGWSPSGTGGVRGRVAAVISEGRFTAPRVSVFLTWQRNLD
jgi:hypothetical protein